MRVLIIAALCAALVWSAPVHSGYLDDLKDLEGKTVLVAGDVEKLACPYYDRSVDCTRWPRNLLRFQYRDMCFETDLLACGPFCKGLIAMGSDQVPYFFEVKSISGKLEKYSARPMACPEL